jgi:flagellar biosynthesis chaperone FliJ
MSMRFRYPLAPILLTRQWELDALLLELAEHNAAVAQQQGRLAHIEGQLAAAGADFRALTQCDTGLPVQRFTILSRYIGDVSLQIRHEQGELERLGALRDALAERVVAAQRGVEAVEKHRDEMETKFIQQRLSGDFKIADDQWSTLQAGMTSHAS